MNLFIDTNVFLSFFHLTSDDLEELRKLIVLIENIELVLWLPQQVDHEFYRNRETTLRNALKELKEYQSKGRYPALCKDYPEYEKLRTKEKEFGAAFAELTKKIDDDIAKESLKADKVIKDLFDKAKYIKTTADLIDSAKNRVDIGNPPGKKGSLGDAINWQALLDKIPNKQNLHLVSGDDDYQSVLDDDLMKGFLLSEWKTNKESDIYFYRRLSEFFKEHYPQIELASEIEKKFSIKAFIKSGSFSQTHTALSKLSTIQEFSESEVNDMIDAFFSNTQIKWIIGESDVNDFYTNLVKKYNDIIKPDNLEFLKLFLKSELEKHK